MSRLPSADESIVTSPLIVVQLSRASASDCFEMTMGVLVPSQGSSESVRLVIQDTDSILTGGAGSEPRSE
jgi:hypothetical protein